MPFLFTHTFSGMKLGRKTWAGRLGCSLENARLEILRKLIMKISVFWDVMPYSVANSYQRFE
jgi:hypothetical protein